MLKSPSEQVYSHLTSKLSELRKKGIEHCSFEAFIKRQSLLLPNWRPITLTLIESPHEQLMLTVRKQNHPKIEEVINVTFSKMSKRFTTVEHRHCFGLIVPSDKKYLIAGRTEGETIDIYTKIINLRREIKEKYRLESEIVEGYREIVEEREDELEFERCDSDQEKYFSTNAHTTPKKESEINYRIIEREQDLRESFVTAQQEEKQEEPEQPIEQQPLHLQQAISEQEIKALESDEGFKLLHNFTEGRFLTKAQQMVKANLLLTSHLTPQELLQTFFHLELWNERVKSYSVVNRIDQGIYLAKLELHRKNIFSLPKYCYLMANTCSLHGDSLLVLRSLQQDHFEQQRGYNYFNFSLWVRVKELKEESQQLMSICAQFKGEKDFEAGLAMLQEIKTYHLFLRTSGQLMHKTLEWDDHSEHPHQ